MIIAFTGRKRAGKDSAAKTLHADGFGRFRKRAFADRVKDACMMVFDLTADQVYGTNGYDREQIDERWGLSPRYILQRFGTEVGRAVHRDTWVKTVILDAQHDFMVNRKHTVITDCRFPNECDAVRKAGGWVVKIERPGVETPFWSRVLLRLPIPVKLKIWTAAKLGDHPSEFCVDLIRPDFVIQNDEGPAMLHAKVGKLRRFLQNPKVEDGTIQVPRGKAIPVP